MYERMSFVYDVWAYMYMYIIIMRCDYILACLGLCNVPVSYMYVCVHSIMCCAFNLFVDPLVIYDVSAYVLCSYVRIHVFCVCVLVCYTNM